MSAKQYYRPKPAVPRPYVVWGGPLDTPRLVDLVGDPLRVRSYGDGAVEVQLTTRVEEFEKGPPWTPIAPGDYVLEVAPAWVDGDTAREFTCVTAEVFQEQFDTCPPV